MLECTFAGCHDSAVIVNGGYSLCAKHRGKVLVVIEQQMNQFTTDDLKPLQQIVDSMPSPTAIHSVDLPEDFDPDELLTEDEP